MQLFNCQYLEKLPFDYLTDYNFDLMDAIVKKNAKENNISIEKHVTDSKENYFILSNYFLETIAECDDPIEIVFLIDKYNRARSAWTHYDIYETSVLK